MVVCFDCSQRTLGLLNRLMREEGYRDYSQIIALAVENLSVIRAQFGTGAAALLRHEPAGASAERHPAKAKTEPIPLDEVRTGSQNRPLMDAPDVSRVTGVFSLSGLKISDDIIIEDTESNQPVADVAPWNWIFGMYNRLLPAKANVRAIARLMAEDDKAGIPFGQEIEHCALRIARDAALLGDILRRHDVRLGLRRDDSLATAFPESDEREDKGRLRYASQFVLRQGKDFTLSGLLSDFAFIRVSDTSVPLVRLTRAGAAFASLSNPVLDGTPGSQDGKFSTEEIEFLLDHVMRYVPAERSAHQIIIDAISAGAATPDSIDASLRHRFGREAGGNEKKWAQLATQRSGVVSRMCDLLLLVRVRSGVRMTYEVTAQGRSFRERLG